MVTVVKPNLADTIRDTKSRVHADEQSRPVPETPMYARLERKEVRVRAGQLEALTALARALMRSRRIKGERITENTLIRVAIDLLLTHQDRMRGGTEHQLRASVSAGLPNSATPEPRASRTPQIPDFATPDLPNPDRRSTSIGGSR
ncbi:hypothetical protein [Microbacterium aurum]